MIPGKSWKEPDKERITPVKNSLDFSLTMPSFQRSEAADHLWQWEKVFPDIFDLFYLIELRSWTNGIL